VNVPLTAFVEDEDDEPEPEEDEPAPEDVGLEEVVLGVGDGLAPVSVRPEEFVFWLVPLSLRAALLPSAETGPPPARDLNDSSRARPTAVSVRASRTLRIVGHLAR
jgi:hypothetical protein